VLLLSCCCVVVVVVFIQELKDESGRSEVVKKNRRVNKSKETKAGEAGRKINRWKEEGQNKVASKRGVGGLNFHTCC